MPEDSTEVFAPTGRVPLSNDVRALVVLVRFSDDNSSAPAWPIVSTADPRRNVLPAFASDLIDATSNPATYRDGTLSDYFYRQSRTGPGGRTSSTATSSRSSTSPSTTTRGT